MSSKPLTDDELDIFEDLIHAIAERADLPLSLEGLDGFIAALACGPRELDADSYLPELVGATAFADDAEKARFTDFFERRRAEVVRPTLE